MFDVMKVGGWFEELASLQGILSEMEVRLVQEPILEEDREIFGRKKAKILSRPVREKRIKEINSGWGLDVKYFMDGFQRTTFLGWIKSDRYVTYVPVHLHLSGAVIVEYNSKDGSHKPVYGPVYQVKILVPSKKILSKKVVNMYQSRLEETIEKRERGEEQSWDPRHLRRKAWLKSSDLRQDLEIKALLSFKPSPGFYIGADGTLPLHPQILGREEIIGIIKNHIRQYLPREDEMKVFDMSKGERSWIFDIVKEGGFLTEKTIVHSVYLKINDYFSDPFHGLLRLEFNPALDDKVDELCSTVYTLREPKASSRDWDREIYPIYLCEQYLEANAISIDSLKEIGRK